MTCIKCERDTPCVTIKRLKDGVIDEVDICGECAVGIEVMILPPTPDDLYELFEGVPRVPDDLSGMEWSR